MPAFSEIAKLNRLAARLHRPSTDSSVDHAEEREEPHGQVKLSFLLFDEIEEGSSNAALGRCAGDAG